MAYDASMINQLLLSQSFYEYFRLNATYIGLNVAIVNVGSFLAGPIAGVLVDWVGRKKSLAVGNSIAVVAVITQVLAKNEPTPLAGRLILGMAFIINSVAGPSLVAESTPGRWHGLLTNYISLAMPVFGTISGAAIFGVYLAGSDWAWRGAILGELGGPILAIIGLSFVPESPRWLIDQNRNEEALEVLLRMHPPSAERDVIVEAEYQQMLQTIHFEKQSEESGASSWGALVKTASDRRRFAIVVLTNIFFQISGSNTFPYFLTLVVQSAGIVEARTTLLVNLGLCIWGCFAVAFGVWFSEYVGAKRFLLANTAIMTLCLAMLALLGALGIANPQKQSSFGIGAVVIIFIFQFVSFSSWMILNYTYPPRILRFGQRAKGFALAQATGFAFCVMMTYILPVALEKMGWRFYATNAAWNLGILAIIWWLFVETKGKTLEEIDALFEGVVHFESGAEKLNATVIEGVEEIADGIPEIEASRKMKESGPNRQISPAQ
ncbi:Lactose permease [Colletotrichum siamense]|nr:Lactose permease [Colletotrichum siamense]